MKVVLELDPGTVLFINTTRTSNRVKEENSSDKDYFTKIIIQFVKIYSNSKYN